MDRAWKAQVYERYSGDRIAPLAPASIEGLRSRSHRLKKLIRDHFPINRNAPILEVGCGYGALVYFARGLGYSDIRGVDWSPDQVAEGRRLGIEIERGDAIATIREQPADSLAALIAFDVIEHFERKDILIFAREAYRVLRPGGRWIVHTVNGSSPFQGDSRYNDITHEVAFTRNSMGQVLMTAGFREIRFFEDVPAVHGLKSAVRWIGWKGIRGMLRLWDAIETGDAGGDAIYSRDFLVVATK
jgi:SAM-dependent methyltransferase